MVEHTSVIVPCFGPQPQCSSVQKLCKVPLTMCVCVCVSPGAGGLLPPSSSAVVVCLSPVPPPPLPASSSDWRTAPPGWSCTQTLLPADSPSLGLC